MILAWVFQLLYNGFHAAGPAYGYNLRNSTSQGWTLICVGSSCLYLSMALSKTAFATTLLRLSSGGLVVVLQVLIFITWAFAIALATIVWLQICEAHVDVGIANCVPINTYMVSESFESSICGMWIAGWCWNHQQASSLIAYWPRSLPMRPYTDSG